MCWFHRFLVYMRQEWGRTHTHTRETTLLMWWKKERKKSEDANRDGGPSNRIGQGARGNTRQDLARAGRRVPCPVHGVGMQFEWMRCDTHHTRQKYDASVSLWDHKSCAYVCISHWFKRAAFDRKKRRKWGTFTLLVRLLTDSQSLRNYFKLGHLVGYHCKPC